MNRPAHPDHLIFLHIPKTAGSTMQSLLMRNYPARDRFVPHRMWQKNPNFFELTDAQRKNIRLLMGHMPFGLHAHLGGGTSEYFTIIREPVDRIVSLYYHILRHPEHPFHAGVKTYPQFPDLLEHGKWLAFDNCQVRMISGELYIPYGTVNASHLALAISNLEKYFPVIGLQDRFDELALMLRDRYGWKTPYYSRQQVGKNREKKAGPDAEAIAAIRKYNSFDEQLFAYARARVEKQLAELGAPFEARVRRFKKQNAFYQRVRNMIPFYKKPTV